MACKHFWTETITVHEMGSRQPLTQEMSRCRIGGRQPTGPGWESKCSSTPPEGPCWFWIESNGDVPDPQF